MGQLGFKRQIYVGEREYGEQLKQAGYVEVMQGNKVTGFKAIRDLFTTNKLDKYKVITSILLSGSSDVQEDGTLQRYFNTYKLLPYQVPKGSFPVLKFFDNSEEADSFISFTKTKLFMFLLGMAVCGINITKEFFRFVPDPNDWTCTYVDAHHPGVTPDSKGIYTLDGVKYCSLYARYNLDQDDINIIESVIKERKQTEDK